MTINLDDIQKQLEEFESGFPPVEFDIVVSGKKHDLKRLEYRDASQVLQGIKFTGQIRQHFEPELPTDTPPELLQNAVTTLDQYVNLGVVAKNSRRRELIADSIKAQMSGAFG